MKVEKVNRTELLLLKSTHTLTHTNTAFGTKMNLYIIELIKKYFRLLTSCKDRTVHDVIGTTHGCGIFLAETGS